MRLNQSRVFFLGSYVHGRKGNAYNGVVETVTVHWSSSVARRGTSDCLKLKEMPSNLYMAVNDHEDAYPFSRNPRKRSVHVGQYIHDIGCL